MDYIQYMDPCIFVYTLINMTVKNPCINMNSHIWQARILIKIVSIHTPKNNFFFPYEHGHHKEATTIEMEK